MGYDPKRPRPSVATESQVDALIEPVAPAAEPLAAVPPVVEPEVDAVVEADLGTPVAEEPPASRPAPSSSAAAPAPDRQPTPVVPAPAEGTANRAVVAAVAAALAALVAVVVLLRRRRQG